eukprot:13315254-Alexandrium_andersonii.AAC.1
MPQHRHDSRQSLSTYPKQHKVRYEQCGACPTMRKQSYCKYVPDNLIGYLITSGRGTGNAAREAPSCVDKHRVSQRAC